MAYSFDQELLAYYDYSATWHKWASQCPSLKHPIKYLKWYFSEPKFEKWKKGKNK